jgi:endoglucanase
MRVTLAALVLIFWSCTGEVGSNDGGTNGGPTDGAVASTGGGSATGGGTGGGTAVVDLWLRTSGNHIVTADGSPWHGRGANLPDTRGCNSCAYNDPDVNEVNRRLDTLVDGWKANFIRLALESYDMAAGRVTWQAYTADAAYRQQVRAIIAHAVTKPGLYVLISLWVDPSFDAMGWPTAATNETWRAIAAEFKDEPRVMFGLVNEPQSNFDGALDSQVWAAMNAAVQVIRDVEGAGPKHLIAVQGTRGWARSLEYYLTHPITAGGGANIVYETHVYNPAADFQNQFERPSMTLPVIIGEFGPVAGAMTEADCSALLTRARALEIPHLAWTFHQRCPPALIQDLQPGGCGVGMELRPTSFGTLLKDSLAQPW